MGRGCGGEGRGGDNLARLRQPSSVRHFQRGQESGGEITQELPVPRLASGIRRARRPPTPHAPCRQLDAFETLCNDAGAGLGKGAIPMRSDTPRLPLVLAALVGGLALFVAGFVIALEVRSVVATPPEAPAAQLPNPGHSYDQIELPSGTWPGLDADKVDGLDASEVGGISACFNQEVSPPATGNQACQQADAYCVTAWNNSCNSYGTTMVPCGTYPAGPSYCARCCR